MLVKEVWTPILRILAVGSINPDQVVNRVVEFLRDVVGDIGSNLPCRKRAIMYVLELTTNTAMSMAP